MSEAVPLGWAVARVLGLFAYVALFLAMFFGVLVGSGGAGGLLAKPLVLELHRRWSLVAVLATVGHVLAVVVDPASGVGPLAAVVPIGSAPVAIGTIAVWGIAAVAITSAAPKRFPAPVWRAVHGTAFGSFLLALVHGVAAGTDTGAVGWLYVVTGAALVGAGVQRGLVAVGRASARGR